MIKFIKNKIETHRAMVASVYVLTVLLRFRQMPHPIQCLVIDAKHMKQVENIANNFGLDIVCVSNTGLKGNLWRLTFMEKK